MITVTAADVHEMRERTGYGMMTCKEHLLTEQFEQELSVLEFSTDKAEGVRQVLVALFKYGFLGKRLNG